MPAFEPRGWRGGWPALCLAICAVAVDPATAHPAVHGTQDRYQRWLESAGEVLAGRADANSLATAAALRFAGSLGASRAAAQKAQSSALELAARASELAPQSASIGWVRLQLCAETPSCDIRDAATAMRWVDADNGAAWIQTLGLAQRDKDTVEIERILADMAQGARFDLYWNRVIVLMVDALRTAHHELPGGYAASDASRLALVEGMAGAELLPRLSPLMELCREPGAERREVCLKLAKTMQKGDTILVQLSGLSIEKRLRAPDGKEARAIAERRRVLEWRHGAAAETGAKTMPWTQNARSRLRLAHMRILAREEDVCIAILRDRKLAVDPPEAHP